MQLSRDRSSRTEKESRTRKHHSCSSIDPLVSHSKVQVIARYPPLVWGTRFQRSPMNPRFSHLRKKTIRLRLSLDPYMIRFANSFLFFFSVFGRIESLLRCCPWLRLLVSLSFAYNLVSRLHYNRPWPRSKRKFSESLHIAHRPRCFEDSLLVDSFYARARAFVPDVCRYDRT